MLLSFAIYLIKRAVEHIAHPFGSSPQPRHITDDLNSIFSTPTASSPPQQQCSHESFERPIL
jgi:hypothetical protein